MRMSKLKVRVLRFWREYARPFLFVAVVLMTFRSSIADWNDVPTGSMNPTILEGDRILVNKLAYDLKVPFTTWHLAEWGNPQRGDIVVFYSPVDGIRLVKRVVGLPGDVVQMVDGRLIVNGRAAEYGPLDRDISNPLAARYPGATFAEERYGDERHPVMGLPIAYSPARNFGPVTVPAGHYFMMGDNRDNSNDSRFYGTVKRELIVGRASRIVASVDSLDKYQPRWKRFFAPLP
jgi:signal peptidase I